MKIGNRLKGLRKEKGMTLKELSKKSGVAIATLSRIEHNIMTGTLQSHMNICRAMGVSLADFYGGVESEEKNITVSKNKEHHDSFTYAKETTMELLTAKIMEKKMMPTLLKMKKGGQTHREENKAGSEKFMYILTGNMTAKIDKTEYKLSRGDSLYFDASLPHLFKNTGKGEVIAIAISTPPEL